MPAIVRADLSRSTGWARLRFTYDRETIAALKAIPGSHWEPETKCWLVPMNAVLILKKKFPKFEVVMYDETRATLPKRLVNRLRPYQVEGAEFLVRNGGAILSFQQRVGKTACAITAACAMLEAHRAALTIVIYPNIAGDVWAEQLKDWASVDLQRFHGLTELSEHELLTLRGTPYLFVGCHLEILPSRVNDLLALTKDDNGYRPFIVVLDESHRVQARKSSWYKALCELRDQPGCVARWSLTGTPMRNRPKNMWTLFDWITRGSMGGYWTYAKKFCGAKEGPHGWLDDGATNVAELAERLTACSFRKTREEVAPWLPAAEWTVTPCQADSFTMKRYRKMESALAIQLRGALSDGDGTAAQREALKQIAGITAAAKTPFAVDRALELSQSGKLVIFAHHHETLKTLSERLMDKIGDDPAPLVFVAGGWMQKPDRMVQINDWKKAPEGSILLANSLSVGVGIDLSEAMGAIFIEPEWVPADLLQVADRLADVHQGKRKAPPFYELLACRDTVDESMILALLNKMPKIVAVVGKDSDTSNVDKALRQAEVHDPSRLGLPNTDRDTVQAALKSIRHKWLTSDEPKTVEADRVAGEVAADWDDKMFDPDTEEEIAF